MKDLWRLLLPSMNVPACGVDSKAISEGETVADRAERETPAQSVAPKSASIFSRTLSKIRR
jgi:hypothetical protein